MKKTGTRILYWLPRILVILFALFISIFALDVFDAGYTFGETLVALFMHLIPTFLILVVLVIAWRWEWIGGMLFILVGLWYTFISGGQNNIEAIALIAGPAYIIGILFLVNWYNRSRAKSVV